MILAATGRNNSNGLYRKERQEPQRKDQVTTRESLF
jgi:hypothetical protein